MRPGIAIAALALVPACVHTAAGPEAPAPREQTAPSKALIREKSHAVLTAFDKGDIAAVRAALADGFVHFEGGTPRTRDDDLARLARYTPDTPHIGTRTWTKEFVYVHPDSAVFVGRADETTAGGTKLRGGYIYHGWYTLAWHRVGTAWKLELWTYKAAGAAAERDQWNQIYRDGVGFNKQPNTLLVETVAHVKPGRALCLAMGQGRNALYLASRGWKVTGVDFSDEAIRIARETATRNKLSLDAVKADINTYDFGTARWDLVTMIYASDDPAWIQKIKPSLKHGGLFVLEYFHDNDKPGVRDGSFAKGELAKLFGDGFTIVRDEVVDGVPDWAKDHASLVRFVARKK